MSDNTGFNIVECQKGRYFIGVWYLYDSKNPNLHHQDWFGTVFRDEAEPNVWHLRYRQKYYHSPDPFDPQDRRSNYEAVISNLSEQEMIEKMDHLTAQLAEAGQFEREFVYFGTDSAEAIFERMNSRPWAHRQMSERKR
jgi:hypothetical protein